MKETIKNNKLIAEFMELVYAPPSKRWDDWFTKDGIRVTFGSRIRLQYNSSWDWLIPVISKIASTEPEFFGGVFQTTIEIIEDSIWENNINTAYDEVCEFIISYNKL